MRGGAPVTGRERDLCALAELEDPGSRGFGLNTAEGWLELFVVRRGGRVYGYRNSCPHTGVTLEWLPHRFLDAEGELIQCGLHGALFVVETGECVHGPCLGAFLEPLEVGVREGWVVLRG
jgi:nitrite reductase/ring-hydroxylating ferredoxin subunit